MIQQPSNAPKRKKGAITTQRILTVSAHLFARQSYDGVSLREIAQEVGIKESSLYNHFPSKQSILDRLIELYPSFVPAIRPDRQELMQMLTLMQPEEILKSIVMHSTKTTPGLIEDTTMVILSERFRSAAAAQVYHEHLLGAAVDYYVWLFDQMRERGLITTPNTAAAAQHYAIIVLHFIQEHFMCKQNLCAIDDVLPRVLETITQVAYILRH